MSWIVWGLASSFIAAAGIELNRSLKKDGATLNFLKQLFMIGLAAPFLPFITWPSHTFFLVAAAAVAVAITVGQTVGFNLAARQQSRVASMVGPVQMSAAFLLWCAIDATFREGLMLDIPRLLLVLAAFGLLSYALSAIRRNDNNWSAFVFVAPVGVMYAIADILAKTVLVDGPGGHLIVAYIFTCGLFALPMLGVFLWVRKIPVSLVFSGSMTGAGFAAAVIGMAQAGCFLMALMQVPNPAYLTAFMMLVPLWIGLWHRVRGIKEPLSVRAMVMMAAGAVLLILSQQWA